MQMTASNSSMITVSDKKLYAHAFLMIIAWMICAPIGMFVSRNYKRVFNKFSAGATAWFKLHLAMEILTFACTVASFVLIYVSVGKFCLLASFAGLFASFFGTIATGFCVVNFIIGFTHCDMRVRKNPKVFRVLHFIFGNGALATSMTSIFIALLMQSMPMPTWVIAFPIGFVVFHLGMSELMIRHEMEVYQRDLILAKNQFPIVITTRSTNEAHQDKRGKRNSHKQASQNETQTADGMQGTSNDWELVETGNGVLDGDKSARSTEILHYNGDSMVHMSSSERDSNRKKDKYAICAFVIYVIGVILFAVATMITVGFFC